ncbi:hypothetical protein L208DRAFT_1508227 [Tricholoma matsutake]|nr:hypothetical protein L208DRAFT_1508227 [Tricholoma matsutake 945]
MCNLPEFQPIISWLWEFLAFMSLSSYTLDWFDVAHWELHIQQGLQSVGKTQFGTIYWSLDSVVQGIPAFTKIVHNADLGIDNLLAIVAHLHDLMMKDDGLKEKSQYSVALKEKIHAIANYWFLQLIENEKLSSTNSHQPKPSHNSLHKNYETEWKLSYQTKGWSHSVEEAKTAMKEINPHLANRNP